MHALAAARKPSMFAFTMAQATRTGVRLHHVEAGAGDPPIVFVHGWCCDLSYLAPQFDHFKSRHRVMAMDLRGCGASDRTEGGYDIPTLADDVARLCRELGLANAVIAGHSLGGMIGVEMAARHPSLVGAVVAVDPGPLAILPESRATFEALIANMQGPDGEAVRREFVSGMFLPADDPDRKRRIIDAMCSAPTEIAIPYLRGVIEWNGAGALHLCATPLLVVVLGAIGLTGWLAKADYVVIPALILCFGLIAFGLYRRRLRRG